MLNFLLDRRDLATQASCQRQAQSSHQVKARSASEAPGVKIVHHHPIRVQLLCQNEHLCFTPVETGQEKARHALVTDILYREPGLSRFYNCL